MQDLAVFFFEPGMPEAIPGIDKYIPAMNFPFWGEFFFLDFHLVNFLSIDKIELYIILEKKQKNLLIKLSSVIKKNTVRIIVLENGVFSLVNILKELHIDNIIFSTLSFVASFNAEFFRENSLLKNNDIIKVSIEKIPMDFYFLKRKRILNLLKSNLSQYTEKMDSIEYVFNTILHTSFDRIEEISGKLFFHNNLQQLFHNNLWLIQNPKCQEFLRLLSDFKTLNLHIHNSYIGTNAYIINSIITSGVEIHGTIENSIIFPDVIIMENSVIKNSVVMNNNKIGKRCTIQNTLIFPYFDEMQNNCYNINENSQIGGKISSIKNELFPDQISGGLSVIGSNTIVPKDFNMENGCYLGPNLKEKDLKMLKNLKKGKSFCPIE